MRLLLSETQRTVGAVPGLGLRLGAGNRAGLRLGEASRPSPCSVSAAVTGLFSEPRCPPVWGRLDLGLSCGDGCCETELKSVGENAFQCPEKVPFGKKNECVWFGGGVPDL